MRRTRENDLEMKLSVMMTMSKGQIFRCLAIAKILRIIRFFPQIAWWYNFQALSKQSSLQKISEQFTFGQEKLFELVDLLQKSHRNWSGAWTEINGFSSRQDGSFFYILCCYYAEFLWLWSTRKANQWHFNVLSGDFIQELLNRSGKLFVVQRSWLQNVPRVSSTTWKLTNFQTCSTNMYRSIRAQTFKKHE